MRKVLFATAALVLSNGIAMAGNSVDVKITAEQDPLCEITTASSPIALGSVVDVAVPGNFEYKCNFVGTPKLTFKSFSGGVTNGSDTATYGIYLNDFAPGGPPSSWLQSNATPQSYVGITTTVAPNVVVSPYFQVGLTQPLPVAGSYTDTLTIVIEP